MATSEEIIGKIQELGTLRNHLRDTATQCAGANIEDSAPSGLYEHQIMCSIYLKELRRSCAKMAGETQKAILKLEAEAKTSPLIEHIVTFHDNLQSLSKQYYGTLHDWPKIMQRNRLTSTVLTPGAKLIIPQ